MSGDATVLVRVTLDVPVDVGVVAAIARRGGITWSSALGLVIREIECRASDGPTWLPSVSGRHVTSSAVIVEGSSL